MNHEFHFIEFPSSFLNPAAPYPLKSLLSISSFSQTLFEDNSSFDVGGFVNGVLMRDACADSSSPYLLGMSSVLILGRRNRDFDYNCDLPGASRLSHLCRVPSRVEQVI